MKPSLINLKKFSQKQLIAALINFADNQNIPTEQIILDNMPLILGADNSNLESSILNIRNDNLNFKNRIENIISVFEKEMEGLDNRIELKSRKIFWNNMRIVFAIVASITGLVAFIIKFLV